MGFPARKLEPGSCRGLAPGARSQNLLSATGTERALGWRASSWSGTESSRRSSKSSGSCAKPTGGATKSAGLIRPAGSYARSGRGHNAWSRDSSAGHGAGCGAEHKLPQFIFTLVFVDLDAGTRVGTGDAGDCADLIGPGGCHGRRVGLAWSGQELIDGVQRGAGRALRAACWTRARLIWERINGWRW
jgi:hypothetical protein